MTTSPDIEAAVAALSLDHKLIDPVRAYNIITRSRESTSRPLLSALLAELSEDAVLKAIATELGLRYYDPFSSVSEFRIDDAVIQRCDISVLTKGSALPLVDGSGRIVVAMANPTDLDTVAYLRQKFPEGVLFVLSGKSQIQARLVYLSSDSLDDSGLSSADPDQATVQKAAPTVTTQVSSPVVDWVDKLLNRAVAEGASDLHLEFNADRSMLLRIRVDGMLRPISPPPPGREMEVIGTIIAKADTMDSSNYREPQDGTFSFVAGGREIDTRVAMLPQLNGPTVVVRLLDSLNMQRRLDDMGFSTSMLKAMRDAIKQAQGTILVAGPTGSGKTTTLYGMLREVDALTRCVLTVEDPVEYKLPYIGQTPIRSDLGDRSLTFARALRSILRLDPDVILVGETRDLDTARTTMDAALTGHLCLSTIHAPSSLRTYTRLIEMGVPPYMVVESITLAISQRLARGVHRCAEMDDPSAEERVLLEKWNLDLKKVARPVGCAGCNNTGYRGRIAISEMLAPSPQMKALLLERPSLEKLSQAARDEGFLTIFDDALRHVGLGTTTVTEVARTIEVESANQDLGAPAEFDSTAELDDADTLVSFQVPPVSKSGVD